MNTLVTGPRDEPTDPVWPALPLADWKETYATLHMWLQIVGKTRLALAPYEPHWWQIALYLTPRGLTTSAMPYKASSVAVEFDFIDHVLMIVSSNGGVRRFPLAPLSVAGFHEQYRSALHSLGVVVPIFGSPVEVETAIPFAEDHRHSRYDAPAVHKCWRILLATDRVMKRFRARFQGKQSPVHFFWGSFDLALTRFSGRHAPRHPGGAPNCPDRVMVEAYSRECASCGFWPGGGATDEPAFYAYTYPRPPEYERSPIEPAGAYWDGKAGEFILPYEVVRLAADPEAALLAFFQSAYEGAANLAAWDRSAVDRPIASWTRSAPQAQAGTDRSGS